MDKMKIETTRGTPVLNFSPSPFYGSKEVATKLRYAFSFRSEHVEIEGECDTKQDLRNMLREILIELEAV